MGSAIGPAFAYFLDPTNGVPAAIAAVNADASVVDGWDSELPQDIFVIGRSNDGDQQASAGTMAYTILGGALLDEEFTIPCFIDCWRGGEDQSEPRTAALAMFDAFVAWLRADLTLGGALNYGRYARMDAISIDGPAAEDATAGRRCQIFFTVRCQNQY